MNYKVGDKLILYTWEELVEKYGINIDGELGNGYLEWSKVEDNQLPNNRIITIDHFDVDNDICFTEDNGDWIKSLMIKGYANEYYLQQIKDEL